MAVTQTTGRQIKDGSVDLAADIFGTLAIANGGTGATTTHGARGNLFSGCRVQRVTSTVAATNNNDLYVDFNSEVFDTDNYHDNSTNPSRLTIPATGIYQMIGAVEWPSNATGRRQMIIKINRTTEIAMVAGPAFNGASTAQVIQSMYQLTAADYVELVVSQSSGGTLNIGGATLNFCIARV